MRKMDLHRNKAKSEIFLFDKHRSKAKLTNWKVRFSLNKAKLGRLSLLSCTSVIFSLFQFFYSETEDDLALLISLTWPLNKVGIKTKLWTV